jgi:hypothetical protein
MKSYPLEAKKITIRAVLEYCIKIEAHDVIFTDIF